MQASDIPTKFAVPFASSAAGANVRDVPVTSADPNAASDTLGFPPNTFIPEGAGGVAPDGRDVNGILLQVTRWLRWYAAAGPVTWDSAFSATVGGYPKGTILAAASFGSFWLNNAENNVTNPDTGGAGWTAFGLPAVQQSGAITSGHFAFWTANNLIIDGGLPGQAAFKAVSDNSKASVASVSGTISLNHIAQFADTNGTLKDGGVLGTMAAQNSNAISVSGGGLSGVAISASAISTGTINGAAISGGTASALLSCSIVSGAANAGFTVTCPGPLLTLQDSGTTDVWILQNNHTTAVLDFIFNASGVANIDQAGNFHTTSDARLKENVADLPASLDTILALRPVEFTYISDRQHRVQPGFIAQELQEHLPAVVAAGREDMLSVAYSQIIPHLVKAVQELTARVAELEARE